MKTGVEKKRLKLLPRVGRYHRLRCAPPTPVDLTLRGPKNEGVSVSLSVTG